ncbi:hypothetical protein HNR06_000039 [Nocardiopsis arvandica]|uniref:DUF732 domain-containing protein n=1 Tax=Nocardiopsis sinuspersici TaxID=501010 RepID=A0A7Y9X9Y5_9ACTN|nr:hypothetical protein [Nocardiopsis sinuspersici]NYH50450.1 hypothetical protein [Nocardiopsis sinuspersici]
MRLYLSLAAAALLATACAPPPPQAPSTAAEHADQPSPEPSSSAESSEAPPVEDSGYEFPFDPEELDERQAHTYTFMLTAWDMPDGAEARRVVCAEGTANGYTHVAESFAESHAQSDTKTDHTLDVALAASMIETFCSSM